MKWVIDGQVAYSDMKLDSQIVRVILQKAANAHDSLDEGSRIGIKVLARGMLYAEERKKPHLSAIYRPPKDKMATAHMLDLFGVMILEVLRGGEISINTQRKDDSETGTVTTIVLSQQSEGESGGQVVDRRSDGGGQDDLHKSVIEQFRKSLSYIEDLRS